MVRNQKTPSGHSCHSNRPQNWILKASAYIKKSTMNSFVDSPFIDAIALVEMPKKLSFPNIKQFESTIDPNDHVSQ
ncbi:hypothetical protein Ddye_024245 [Dipteronia dyeriana]|uniref:Uncharacterized protein n=1 Tax=Dipteronia dyeriana TaxID=168575 RepID=A0AAD9WU25_9ROSI|nr:hypothetical protein Ddye_024245 [Dipteronia dyeriana]